MGFEILESITPQQIKAKPTATLRHMPFRRKDQPVKDGAKPRLILTVPTSVVISNAKTFQFLIGDGKDSGKTRLVGLTAKDANGTKPHKGCVVAIRSRLD